MRFVELIEGSPFEGLQKGVVMHEVRIFSEPQISPRNCCKVLTKILYLLCQGETFTSDEATSVFFGTTKLFQSQNVHSVIFDSFPRSYSVL